MSIDTSSLFGLFPTAESARINLEAGLWSNGPNARSAGWASGSPPGGDPRCGYAQPRCYGQAIDL